MHSQNLEEKYILDYFKDYESGTFLSVGENDGETLSNVRALALTGKFCGVMIEPSPVPFSKLKKLYENEKKGCFYLYNCAIGKHNGRAVLHDSGSLLKTGDTGLVSTMVEEEKKRFQSVVSYEPVEVKCYRWKTLLNRLTLKEFQFINIDAESMDYEILIQIDLSQVRLLCIEWNSIELNRLKILEYTSKFGMDNVIYTSGENLIICRK